MNPSSSDGISPPTGEKVEGKRRALGRGLEMLLPAKQPAPLPEVQHRVGKFPEALQLQLDTLDRNPFQTRTNFNVERLDELARSIEMIGVVQPILVRPINGNRYQLIAGERRWLASKKAGKTSIPAIVCAVSDEQAMEMTIVENLQREDLNPLEQARAFYRLGTEFRMTQEQMAIRTGKERASVANFLRLLKLPPPVQQYLENGTLTMGHARALLALPDPGMMTRAADYAVDHNWSVRKTETYVQDVTHPEAYQERRKQKEKIIEPQDPNVHAAQDRLQRTLGMRVRIEDRGGRGRVIIEYSDVASFDLLLAALHAEEGE